MRDSIKSEEFIKINRCKLKQFCNENSKSRFKTAFDSCGIVSGSEEVTDRKSSELRMLRLFAVTAVASLSDIKIYRDSAVANNLVCASHHSKIGE